MKRITDLIKDEMMSRMYENEYELTGKYDAISTHRIKEFFKSIGYKMPTLQIKTTFKLPETLNLFQSVIYNTLVHYKHEKLKIFESGKVGDHEYDVVLPEEHRLLNIFLDIREDVTKYLIDNGIRMHRFFNHLASSQAACFNLFMSLTKDINLANDVLRTILPNFDKLERVEYEYYDKTVDHLGENRNQANKTNVGTDVDVAIFYLTKNGKHNVCLIEHKLSEKEFSFCNAIKNKNQNKNHCGQFSNVWNNSDNCYYQKGKDYMYWKLTKEKESFFDESALASLTIECPFRYSLQQLWRNMLLAQELERKRIVDKAYFAVIYHLHNKALWNYSTPHGKVEAFEYFSSLLKDKDRFFRFTLQDVVLRAKQFQPNAEWIDEYESKYLHLRYDS